MEDKDDTPWGPAQSEWNEEIADGVTRISTAGHGGLRFSPERRASIPAGVMGTFMNPGWAEEDCEAPIAIAVLGIGGEHQQDYEATARRMAEEFDTYAPCAPHIAMDDAAAAPTGAAVASRAAAASRELPRCGYPMPRAKRPCGRPAGHTGSHA